MPGFGDLPVRRLCAEWLEHGLSTEPADFDATEDLIKELYTRAGLAVPKRFDRVSSPSAALPLLAESEAAHGLPKLVPVPSTGWQGAYDEHRGRVWMALEEAPWHTAQSAVWNTLPPTPRGEVQDAVWAELSHVQDLGYAVWDKAEATVGRLDEDTRTRWRGSCMFGQNRAVWFCIFTAWGMLGADVSAMQPHIEIGKLCGWWGWEHLVVMVDRPAEVGEAVVYRDGWTAELS